MASARCTLGQFTEYVFFGNLTIALIFCVTNINNKKLRRYALTKGNQERKKRKRERENREKKRGKERK